MDSVLILTDNAPFGTNSASEAIRLGAGYLGLGEDVDCKIILYGDAVLLLKNNLEAQAIGMDPVDEGIEMADLTDMPLYVVKEDLLDRGISAADLIEYDELVLIDRAAIPSIIGQAGTVFHM